MIKPFVAAVAALFAIQPALAAPTLNDFTVYASEDVDVAKGTYGHISYGTTYSEANVTNTTHVQASTPALNQQALDLSAYYKGLAGTPYTITNNNPPAKKDFTITGVAGPNVIQMTTAEIGEIEQLLRIAPVGATQFVFNIPGLDVNAALFELSLPAGLTADKILFNFFEAEKVSGTNATIYGTILAPKAVVSISKLTIEGIVVAKDFNAANVDILGKGFLFGPGPGVPEPTTWAMLILGFAVIGSAMRRRAAAKPALAA